MKKVDKIHRIMELLNWQYFEYGKGMISPNIDCLKKTAKQNLEYALEKSNKKKKDYFTSSGGFKATAHYYKDRVKELKLEFILEQYES